MQRLLQIVLMVACYRLLPHPFNATPLLSIGLFSGILIANPVVSVALPVACMLLADVFLGFYSSVLFTYAALMLCSLLGIMIKNHYRFGWVMAASALSALIFFVITNLGTFLTTNLYPHSLSGLWICLLMALPFFCNTLLSTLGFSCVFWLIGALPLNRTLNMFAVNGRHL